MSNSPHSRGFLWNWKGMSDSLVGPDKMRIQVQVESHALLGYRLVWLLTASISCFCFLLAQQDVPEAQKNPFAGSAAASEAGLKIYDGACQGCHGAGAGGSERAPALAGGSLKY